MKKPIALILIVFSLQALAEGPLTPPGPPGPTMKTLQEIWDKIGGLETEIQTVRDQNQTLQALLAASGSLELAWQTSTVDPNANCTKGVSLAIGPGGNPAIAYYDATGGDLKYAAWNGTNWVLSTIDSADDVGQTPSLQFAQDGRPAVAYQNYTNIDLKYAKYDGTAWQVTTVEAAGETGYFPSLVFTSSGQANIAYARSAYGLRLARLDGTTWIFEQVSSPGAIVTSNVSLARSSNDKLAIASVMDGDMQVYEQTGNGWSFSSPILSGSMPVLAFGPADRLAICFSAGGFSYSEKTTNWTTVQIAPGSTGFQCTLAFGLNGQPCVALVHPLHTSLIARKNSGWPSTATNVGLLASSVPRAIDLKIDHTGLPIMVFGDGDSGNRLTIARQGLFGNAQ